jgi:hypothetical protein
LFIKFIATRGYSMMRIPVDDAMRMFLTPSQHGNNELRQEQRTAHRLGARVTLFPIEGILPFLE